MPSRNIIKDYAPESYYHIYSRGNNKQTIFFDTDYSYFIKLLDRYLLANKEAVRQKSYYPNFSNNIKILAYCLKYNHFHLLIYQKDCNDIEMFMKSIMTSYSMYFNLRHKRRGPLFESRYKASLIDSDEYLQHVSRYIHLNPKKWKNYEYSSLKYYTSEAEPEWLDTATILQDFSSKKKYLEFIEEDEDRHIMLNRLKHELE